MSHIQMSHATHAQESCHTCKGGALTSAFVAALARESVAVSTRVARRRVDEPSVRRAIFRHHTLVVLVLSYVLCFSACVFFLGQKNESNRDALVVLVLCVDVLLWFRF